MTIIFAGLFGIMAALAGIPWFVMVPIVIVAAVTGFALDSWAGSVTL